MNTPRLIFSQAQLSLRRAPQIRRIFSRSMATSAHSFAKELRIACLAVQRATLATQEVFRSHAKGTISKEDKSPVTIGDYASQALVVHALQHAFPEDAVVGEEESGSLRSREDLATKVWDVVRATKLEGAEEEDQGGLSAADAEIGGSLQSREAMLASIDAGSSAGGSRGRFWALDPIDGTLGFLRGQQYAVCLALVIDGVVEVGVLGCPNLPVDVDASGSSSSGSGASGVLFSAVRGQGAFSRPLGKGDLGPAHGIHMRSSDSLADASFCESVEASHSAHDEQAEVAKRLGITKPSVRMDSQAKYGSIARGAGDVYLRLPRNQTYVECIWDHAAGDLIVSEAGGVVSDINGKKLDFGTGRKLTNNKGVIAAPQKLYKQVLEAVMGVLAEKGQERL